MQPAIYLVFSATTYRIGKMIRFFTHSTYNHVAITDDGSLQTMYAFARRYHRTPLLGGFVVECPARYMPDGNPAHICVCRLPLSPVQANRLRAHLSAMAAQPSRYLYNFFSALGALFHKRVPLRDACTCTEFAVQTLSMLGFPVDPHRFYGVDTLQQQFAAHTVYTGPFPAQKTAHSDYFQKHPVAHPFFASLCGFFALFGRISKRTGPT